MSAEPVIIFTEQLNPDQEKQLLALEAACRLHDGISLSAPAREPDTLHWLLYPSSRPAALAAALSLSLCGDEAAECTAFTLPEYRRRGYFSLLLDQALPQAGELDILFPVSNRCADALASLKALGAELESEELQMELDITSLPLLSAAADNLSLHSEGGESTRTFTLMEENSSAPAFLPAAGRVSGAIPLGRCQTSSAGPGSVCLHHVEIFPEFRGRGLGHAMMALLLNRLKASGVRRVLLQVSADNAPALALYKKTGFCMTQSLSFYLY
ncbi:MAG: GNAT family N-acetyltransferase [Eubacteriales bacterium]|nr:GNAT family N-acetyltransferase [Eubacteriales bacterium]